MRDAQPLQAQCSHPRAEEQRKTLREHELRRTTRLVLANVSAACNSSTSLLLATAVERCEAAASLASLVPASLAWLVLAPTVLIGACAEPNIRGHGQSL